MKERRQRKRRKKKQGWRGGEKEVRGEGKRLGIKECIRDKPETGRISLEVSQDRSKFYFNI